MLCVEQVKSVPEGFEAVLSEEGKRQVEELGTTIDRLVSISPHAALIRDGDKPLMLIGVSQITLTDSHRWLWLFATKHLRLTSFRCRKFREWLGNYVKASQFPVLVYTRSPETTRFAAFFGFAPTGHFNGLTLHEWEN